MKVSADKEEHKGLTPDAASSALFGVEIQVWIVVGFVGPAYWSSSAVSRRKRRRARAFSSSTISACLFWKQRDGRRQRIWSQPPFQATP
jgi:hypothetical protein